MTERKNKKKESFHILKDTPIKWKDIKDLDFEDDDTITIGYDEGHYSENNSWDPHYFLIAERIVPETDEEMEERIKMEEFQKEEMRKKRYENYLRLKKEFEGE